MIEISSDGKQINYLDQKLNEEDALLLTNKIRQQVMSYPGKLHTLDLSCVKSMEVNAARILAGLSDIEEDAVYPDLVDTISFGLEYLSEEIANALAQFPSRWLRFDRVTSLPDAIAKQFIRSHHCLTFNSCTNFSPVALSAISRCASGYRLELGLRNINVQQAKVLARYSGELQLVEDDELQEEVLRELWGAESLLSGFIWRHFGMTEFPVDEYENRSHHRLDI